MKNIRAISLVFFVLSIFRIQNLLSLHIEKIRNESNSPVIIIVQSGKESQRYEIPEHSIIPVNIYIPSNADPISARLDRSVDHIKIITTQATFLCAEGKRKDIQNPDFIRYGLWIQREPKLSKSQEDKEPSIRILRSSYNVQSHVFIQESTLDKEPEPLATPHTLTITSEGTVT